MQNYQSNILTTKEKPLKYFKYDKACIRIITNGEQKTVFEEKQNNNFSLKNVFDNKKYYDILKIIPSYTEKEFMHY